MCEWDARRLALGLDELALGGAGAGAGGASVAVEDMSDMPIQKTGVAEVEVKVKINVC